MSTAGKTVGLRRYGIPAGERARAQRIDGRVAVIDVHVDHPDRHVHNYAELTGLAAEYAARSKQCRIPAILAIAGARRDNDEAAS